MYIQTKHRSHPTLALVLALLTLCALLFTPAALAEVAPKYAAIAPVAYAQIATAVIITAVLAPILTGWVDKRFCQAEVASK